jgi:hypothetical protein
MLHSIYSMFSLTSRLLAGAPAGGACAAADDDETSKIAFPKDPAINICMVRSYLAVAMTLWYQPDLRGTQARAWDELDYAWYATFS